MMRNNSEPRRRPPEMKEVGSRHVDHLQCAALASLSIEIQSHDSPWQLEGNDPPEKVPDP